MRWGMIVRADRRGLAYQTGEMWRAMQPDVTVCVDISQLPRSERWQQDFDQYPGAIVTTWNPAADIHFSDEALDALLSCDVVYSAETLYDDNFSRLARGQTATVRHINCELYWPEGESHPIYPTSWRLPGRPDGPTVPVPVPDERIAAGPAGDGLVLHVAGWQAAHDRNGTQLVRNAIRRSEAHWRVTSQYGEVVGSRETNVERVGELADRWGLYDGCGLLMMPRRYGGLCLPAQEAAARGLAIAMTSIPPQVEWPIVPLSVSKRFTVRGRRVEAREIVYADPTEIARIAETLRGDDLVEWQLKALDWARSLAWSKWEPEYRRMLHRAAEEVKG